MGGSSKSQTTGYGYFLGMHVALCHGPVDKITHISVDDREAWQGDIENNETILVHKPSLFGGSDREGGISGFVEFLFGGDNQFQSPYLLEKLKGFVPAFRGITSVVLQKFYLGNNPYIKPWAFRAQRIHRTGSDGREQWHNDKAEIGGKNTTGTMNPVHIIRECLTNNEWGMGYNEQDIDGTSFIKAADTLFDENFGLCLLWSSESKINEFISLVLEHINGELFVSRNTGRFFLTLIRDDIDAENLPVLDESIIAHVDDFTQPAVGDLINSVTIKYWDMTTGQDDSFTVHDPALVQSQGSVNGVTKQYPGIPSRDLAAKIASRDLKTGSTPLIGCTLECNRKAAGLNIGDAFVLKWTKLGIDSLVMRVTRLGLGTPNDGRVIIECVQDVFTVPDAIYAPSAPTAWEPIISKPQPVDIPVIREAPYYEVAQRLGDIEAAKLEDGEGYILVSGVRPTGDSISAGLHLSPVNAKSVERVGHTYFCPTGVIENELNYLDTTLTILLGDDLEDIEVGNYIEINDEFMAVDAIEGNELTVTRGVLDTLPQQHSAGSRLFAWENFASGDEKVYLDGETVYVKLTPLTGEGEMLLSQAPEERIELGNRAYRPYPPGNVTINEKYYPPIVFGNLEISWSHRNRLQQTSGLFGFLTDDIQPEGNTQYQITLMDRDDDSYIVSRTTLDTIFAYTTAQELADNGKIARNVTVIITTLRGDTSSLQSYRFSFVRNFNALTNYNLYETDIAPQFDLTSEV